MKLFSQWVIRLGISLPWYKVTWRTVSPTGCDFLCPFISVNLWKFLKDTLPLKHTWNPAKVIIFYLIYSELFIIRSLYSVLTKVHIQVISCLKRAPREGSRPFKAQMRITVIFHVLIYIFVCFLSCRIKAESYSRGEYMYSVALGIKILLAHFRLFYCHFKWKWAPVCSSPVEWFSGWDASQVKVTPIMFTNNKNSYSLILNNYVIRLGEEELFEGKVSCPRSQTILL